jgi:hypothetical protein
VNRERSFDKLVAKGELEAQERVPSGHRSSFGARQVSCWRLYLLSLRACRLGPSRIWVRRRPLTMDHVSRREGTARHGTTRTVPFDCSTRAELASLCTPWPRDGGARQRGKTMADANSSLAKSFRFHVDRPASHLVQRQDHQVSSSESRTGATRRRNNQDDASRRWTGCGTSTSGAPLERQKDQRCIRTPPFPDCIIVVSMAEECVTWTADGKGDWAKQFCGCRRRCRIKSRTGGRREAELPTFTRPNLLQRPTLLVGTPACRFSGIRQWRCRMMVFLEPGLQRVKQIMLCTRTISDTENMLHTVFVQSSSRRGRPKRDRPINS